MKLTAIIFLVWVATAQSQSSSSTDSSSTVTSATSSTGSTVTVSTVTGSTSTGSTGSTSSEATTEQSTSTGTIASTTSGGTGTSSTGSTVSATTGSTSTANTGSTSTGATSAQSTSTGTIASTTSGATGTSSTGSTVSTATGSTSTGSTGSTSTGATSAQSTSTRTIAFTTSGATGSSSTASVVSTTTNGIAGSTASTSTGPVVDTTSGGTGSSNTGAVPTTSAGGAGSTSSEASGGPSTGTPSAVIETTPGSGSAGITTTSNTADITTPTVGGTTTVGVGTIAPGLTTTPSSNITQTVPDVEATTEVPIQSTTPGSLVTATLIVTPNTSENVTVGNTVPVTPIQIPTSRPIPDCTPIEAPARLRINGARPCLVKKFNAQSIQIKSPDFPENYPNSVECKARTSSAGPRYLVITPKLVAVHKSDRLVIKGPFGFRMRIRSEDLNNPITLPSAYSKIEFKSNDRKTMKGFRVNVRSKTNSCQRICSLQAGASGYLNNGPYGANSFCEWWLEAPTGCFIRMRFEEFDVGSASSGGAWSCEGDYVGVDRDGDPTYGRPRSRTFCGSDIPKGVRSVDNKINVLFNGRDGGYSGFKIKYTVVC